jgi:TP901 family phage tail tape measure protein
MAGDVRRFNVIVGMAFNPGDAVQQAARTADQITDVFRRASAVPVGMFDRQMAVNFGNELRAQVQRAVGADVRNSPLFQSMRPVDQAAVRSTAPTDTSRYLAEQIALTRAHLAQAATERKAAKPLGSEGGFANKYERQDALLASTQRVEQANRRLAAAQEKHAAQAERQATSEANLANRQMQAMGREINAILDRERNDRRMMDREFNTRGQTILAMQRRKDAEDAATAALQRQTASQQAADRAAAGFGTPGVPTTALGRAQAGVTSAGIALESAQMAYARVLQSETRTAEQVMAAQRRVINASNQLASARSRVAALESAATSLGSGGSGSFRGDFMTGFHGRGDRPYAEQIGQAFKFSIFYGTAYKLLFGITQTFQATLQEGIAFQQGITELRLATGRSVEAAAELANKLGESSANYGFGPSAGIEIGARSIGLYGATGADQATQDRIAQMSAETVSKIAFNSGMQASDIQANVAAITQAFGMGAAGQYRVADLDAYFSRVFGIGTGQTLETVAQAGTVGRAAGFSQEEVSAIAADMISRTGQTPAAVAGFMAQIFSRGGEGSLTSVAGKYGIDPTLTLADQIDALARVYQEATNQERAEISAAFGRGKVQNAAIALLQDYEAVRQASRDARTDATGAADRATQMRLGDIGGQLQVTLGSMKEFASVLGQSGLLEVLGVGVLVFRELIEGATELIRLWNELDGPLKAAAAGLVALALAARGGALTSVASGALGNAALFRSAGGMYAGGVPIAAGRMGIATAGGAVAPLASRAGLAAGAGALLGAGGGILPIAAAVGGLYAVGELAGSSRRLREAQESASEALQNSDLAPGAGPDSYRTRAAELTAQAAAQREAASGWAARIVGGGSQRSEALDMASALSEEAARLERVARRAEQLYVEPERPLIESFDADGLAQSLDLISASGGTARERLDALQAALLGTADAARTAEQGFDRRLFAGENAQGVFEAISGQQYGRVLRSEPGMKEIFGSLLTYSGTGPLIEDREYKDITGDLISKALTQSDVEGRLREQLAGITDLGELDRGKINEIAQQVVGDTANSLSEDAIGEGGLSAEDVAKVQEVMIGRVRRYLLGQTRGLRVALQKGLRLTQAEGDAAIAALMNESAALVDSLPETDYSGRVAEGRRLIRTIRATIRRTAGGGTPQMLAALASAERQLAEMEFNRLENARRVAQQNARSRAEVARIGRSFLRRELRAAIRGGNQDLLAQIIGQAGSAALRIAREMIQEAINAARAANQIRLEMLQVQREAQGALSNLDFVRGGQGPGLQPTVTPENQGLLDVINNTPTAGSREDDVYTSGSDVPGYKPPPSAGEAAAKDKETAAERAAAAQAAYAVRSESSIAAARAEISAARAAMAEAKKGTVAYYDALGQYFAARNSLTDAILEYRNTKMMLGIDITNPLATARVALRAAEQQLRSNRGKGEDVVAQSKLDVRQAQADLEAQKFQQRLDAVTVAEELGRISHRAYINYLENERRRLNRIKDRSYQQQQQLNQIDQLLQSAAEAMQGQWNFGDINLPTPYQIRRRVEEMGQATGLSGQQGWTNYWQQGGASTGQSITNINIDGADVGMVKKILREVVGEYARTTGSRPRHR